MKNSILGRFLISSLCAVLLTLTISAHANAQNSESGNVKFSIAKVHRINSAMVIPQAGASLARSNEGVLGTISTSGLTPGHVTTFWWAIFNNPEYCATPVCAATDFNNPAVNGSLQFGGGTIADVGGRATFIGYLAIGDNTGFYLNPAFPNLPNPAPGIVDTKKAQIHLSIRTHGAPNPDPAIYNQQLTSFPGGCSGMPSPCATIQAAVFMQQRGRSDDR